MKWLIICTVALFVAVIPIGLNHERKTYNVCEASNGVSVKSRAGWLCIKKEMVIELSRNESGGNK